MAYYEGLIFKTAQIVVASGVEIEIEDAQQRLRIKAWRALKAFDPARCRTTRAKYVFMCVKDEKKDLLKKKRRFELHIEDQVQRVSKSGTSEDQFTGDRFHEQYLSATHDDVFGEVEDDDLLIPSTVTAFEKRVLLLLYTGDYKQREIAAELLPLQYELDEEAAKREVERAIRALRDKFADWRPSSDNPMPAVAV